MTGLISLGSNYTIEEDSNGDYVLTYTPTNTVIERIDSGNEEKIFEVATQISDLTDATSGATVYDSSAEELTADVNNQSVSASSGKVGEHTLGPFQTPDVSTVFAPTNHVGLTSVIFPVANNDWTVVYRRGPTHNIDTNSHIEAFDSDDQATEASNFRTILDDATDARNFGGRIMANGRLGLMVARDDGSGRVAPKFVYSDDDGATWSATELTGLTPPGGTYEMSRYPASVGGDDATGFVVPATTNPEIVGYTTTDNGDTWNEVTWYSNRTNQGEPTITRLGGEDKWLMVTRTNDAGEAWTSTDLSTWDGPYTMNVPLGGNRPKLFYDDGQVHLLTFNRASFNNGLSDHGENALIQRVDADTIFNNPGSAWPGWEVLANGESTMVGYPDVKKTDGQWFATFCDGEQDNDAVSKLSLLSSRPSPSLSTRPQSGIVSLNTSTLTGEADGSWDTFSNESTTVSFDEAFDRKPNVVATVNASGYTAEWQPFVGNESKTEFDLQVRHYGTTDLSAKTLKASWIAVPDRP